MACISKVKPRVENIPMPKYRSHNNFRSTFRAFKTVTLGACVPIVHLLLIYAGQLILIFLIQQIFPSAMCKSYN